MTDRNGEEINVGDIVVDVHGNEGECVMVREVKCLRVDIKGKEKYVFSNGIMSSEIRKVLK